MNASGSESHVGAYKNLTIKNIVVNGIINAYGDEGESYDAGGNGGYITLLNHSNSGAIIKNNGEFFQGP